MDLVAIDPELDQQVQVTVADLLDLHFNLTELWISAVGYNWSLMNSDEVSSSSC